MLAPATPAVGFSQAVSPGSVGRLLRPPLAHALAVPLPGR